MPKYLEILTMYHLLINAELLHSNDDAYKIKELILEVFEEDIDARDIDLAINSLHYEEEDTRLILKHSGYEMYPDFNDRSFTELFSEEI